MKLTVVIRLPNTTGSADWVGRETVVFDGPQMAASIDFGHLKISGITHIDGNNLDSPSQVVFPPHQWLSYLATPSDPKETP